MISIAQISDTHLLCPSKASETDIVKQRIENLKRCVDSINNLDPQPDIVIHTGDVTQNGKVEEYKIADTILKKLKQRIFFTPGNRDNKPNLRKIFTQSLSEKTDKEFYIYSIEFKGFKLISMDSFCCNSNKGELTSSKIKLLSNELFQSRRLPTAIFMHHPPYNVSDNKFERIEYVDIEEVKKFHYFLKNKSNIVALFCGHIHKNFESNIGHIKTFTMPSIATDLSWDKEISKKSKNIQYLLHSFSKKTGIYTKKILVQ
ncbi:metallophosphoesterase [SAR116 cluster bacterium]|nr:metallophosphoesterase [SAR116 cluster bacterium]